MIATPVPPSPQPNTQASIEIQAEAHFGSDVQQIVKELYLRKLLNGEIKENEAAGVLTGISIVDLKSGRSIVRYQENVEHFAASINKLPVALLVLEDLRSGKLKLDQTMTWQSSDRRAGFGVYDQADSPLSAPLRDVLYDLLNRSGNTAVRILVNQGLGGAAAVNGRWGTKQQLSHTRLQPVDANRFFLGNTTPSDSLWTMQQLMKKQDAHAAFIRNALATNIFDDFGVRSQLSDKQRITLVNKIGLLDDVEGNNRHDVGIIYNQKKGTAYVYSFMTTAPYNETDPSATEQADESLGIMGRHLLRFAGDKQHPAQVDTVLHPSLKQQITVETRLLY